MFKPGTLQAGELVQSDSDGHHVTETVTLRTPCAQPFGQGITSREAIPIHDPESKPHVAIKFHK